MADLWHMTIDDVADADALDINTFLGFCLSIRQCSEESFTSNFMFKTTEEVYEFLQRFFEQVADQDFWARILTPIPARAFLAEHKADSISELPMVKMLEFCKAFCLHPCHFDIHVEELHAYSVEAAIKQCPWFKLKNQ